MEKEQFTVTANHIKLLQRAYVSWEDYEFGAPSIDCQRPYGNSDVLRDIVEILEIFPEASVEFEGIKYPISVDRDISPALEERLVVLHKETQTALQIFLQTGKMEPGVYEREKYGGKWVLMVSPYKETRTSSVVFPEEINLLLKDATERLEKKEGKNE